MFMVCNTTLFPDAVSDGCWISTLCRPMVQVLFRVALDLVSALNSWWNSGSSFGLSFFKLRTLLFRCFFVHFSCFWCIQSPCFASFVWSPLLTLLWAKIAIFVGYLMGGWWIFVAVLFESSTVYKALSSKKCD